MTLPGKRGWLVAGTAAAILAVSATAVLTLGSASAEPPAAARAAVHALVNGSPGEVEGALSPLLAAQVIAVPGRAADTPVDIDLRDWHSDGVFAGATATIRFPDREVPLDVGFRLVQGTWRITYAQARSS